MYVYYIYIYIHTHTHTHTHTYIHTYIYSRYILYRPVCPTVVQSNTVQDEVVNHLTPRKYSVFNENVMCDLWDVFQEHNPGVKQDLPVIQNTIQQESHSLESYDKAFPTAQPEKLAGAVRKFGRGVKAASAKPNGAEQKASSPMPNMISVCHLLFL